MNLPVNFNFNLRELNWTVAVPAGLAVGTATFYIYRKYYCHRYFKNIGIPGPEPHWLYGNLREIQCDNRHEVMAAWTKKYGGVFGYYEGPNPILVASDLEAIQQICVKQFPSFQGHHLYPLAPDPSETDSLVNHMLWAQGELWKRLRTSVNPAFSSGKLKAYTPLLAQSEEEFMALIEEQVREGKSFDIRSLFQLLSLDVIAVVGFGLDLKVIRTKGEGNQVLRGLRDLSELSFRPHPFIDFLRAFPVFVPLAKGLLNLQLRFMVGMYRSAGKLLDLVGKVTRNRVANEKYRRVDLLQLMVDSSDMVPSGEHNKGPYKPLNEREIKAMVILFFLAGYESTASMLAYVSYVLARNPDIQDKLVAEIYEKYPKDSEKVEPDYDTVMSQMPYLDMVCRETLRLYPFGVFATSRYVVGEANICGYELGRGCHAALIDTWSVHQNPDLWGPDPEKFEPERFSPEQSANRPDAAFQAFGYGPRQCIGMRLALFEMKLTLVKMLHRFRVVEPDGGYPASGLRVTTQEGSFIPIDGVPVKIVSRIN